MKKGERVGKKKRQVKRTKEKVEKREGRVKPPEQKYWLRSCLHLKL